MAAVVGTTTNDGTAQGVFDVKQQKTFHLIEKTLIVENLEADGGSTLYYRIVTPAVSDKWVEIGVGTLEPGGVRFHTINDYYPKLNVEVWAADTETANYAIGLDGIQRR